MHRSHVAGAEPPLVSLTQDEAHHVTRVLRLSIGSELAVFDGQGHEWLARIVAIDRARVQVALVEPRAPAPEPDIAVTLAVALLKGDQMSSVVRDATALGVEVIAPFVAEHVVVPAHAAGERSVARWARIAVSAAAQSGRAVVPQVAEVQPFSDLIAAPVYDARIVLAEPASGQAAHEWPQAAPRRVLLCVGPEGGWSEGELALAREHHATFLRLGPRTLRAELAPAVALSALWTRWGWR